MTKAVLFAFLLAACEKPSADAVENATPSPNASILPAPLPSVGLPVADNPVTAAGRPAESSGRAYAGDAGAVVPQSLRSDQAPDADPIVQRELTGITLDGEWRFSDLTQPPKAPEVNGTGIEVARKLTAPRMIVDLAAMGRMRVTFASRALPLGDGAEIRSRADRYGHFIVWPDTSRYRVLPPGAVRTVLEERRVDAVPLVRAQTVGHGDGSRRAGFATKKWELATRTGRLVLEQAKIPAAGEGAVLFCRFLSELVSIDPSAAPCAPDDVPLRAQLIWPDGGSTAFEVVSLSERVDFAAERLLSPPTGSSFVNAGLPPDGVGIFLTRDELQAFRQKPIETGAVPGRGAPAEGIVLRNATDSMKIGLLDAVPIAWVLPNKEQWVIGPPKGRYLLQWRTFLGDVVGPALSIDLPATVVMGPVLDGGK